MSMGPQDKTHDVGVVPVKEQRRTAISGSLRC